METDPGVDNADSKIREKTANLTTLGQTVSLPPGGARHRTISRLTAEERALFVALCNNHLPSVDVDDIGGIEQPRLEEVLAMSASDLEEEFRAKEKSISRGVAKEAEDGRPAAPAKRTFDPQRSVEVEITNTNIARLGWRPRWTDFWRPIFDRLVEKISPE